MTRRPRPLTTRGTLGLACTLILAAGLPACGPRWSSTTVSTAGAPGAPADPVEAEERRAAEAIARVRESAVALEYSAPDGPSGARRVASGVVVGTDGDVLSVRIAPPSAAAPVVARVASGRRLPARWIAADPETGLTLLKIEPGAARPATPAPVGARLGMPVLIVGNPFGLAHSVGRGFVAGLGRRLELDPRQLGGLIQIDAALHPGDSGAPVADLRGGWLGVIRSGLAPPGDDADPERRTRDDDHDLGFAIPAAGALWVAEQLRTRGRVDRAYLGVTMDAAAAPDAPDGAVLGRIVADTPAERAGLKAGDRVVAIDGRPVHTPYDLTDRLDLTPANAEVTLDLVRGDGPARRVQRLTFRADRRPPLEPSRPARPRDRERERPKSRPDDPAPRRDLAATIDRLERRVRELEKENRTQAERTRPR